MSKGCLNLWKFFIMVESHYKAGKLRVDSDVLCKVKVIKDALVEECCPDETEKV